MGRYLQGKDGKMAGSIGDGKDKVPTAAPMKAQPKPVTEDPNAASRVAAYYEALKAPRSTAPAGRVTLVNTDGVVEEYDAGDLDSASHFLTNGNCHSVAAALHRVTGYPIVLFYSDGFDIDEDDEEDQEHIRHVGVLTPDGYLLDGDGAMKLTTVMARCGWDSEVIAGGIEELEERIKVDTIQHEREWSELDPDNVASFAGPILGEYYSRR